jgi:hypothetical protein
MFHGGSEIYLAVLVLKKYQGQDDVSAGGDFHSLALKLIKMDDYTELLNEHCLHRNEDLYSETCSRGKG